ncbi:MAG TPA: hypothetical protein VII93_05960 [Anaerolineales bacterium]
MRLTIRQLFFVLLFTGLFLMTLRPVVDPDFWWHLRTGQLIVQSHVIPHTDPYSFTNNGKPWVAQEWLSELIMYGLYRLGSYGLLIFVFSLTITGAFFLSYLCCPTESKPYIAGFVLLLGAIATAPTWGVRPQMISLFFTSLVLYLLSRYWREVKIKYLIPLPLMTLIWANLHAGYILGLVIMALFISGALIELFLADVFKIREIDKPRIKTILILCGVFGLSTLTTMVNPNGINLLIYPFQTLTSQAMQQFIQEWFSPDFHQLMWQPLAWFILVFIGSGMIGKKFISPIKIILTLFFGYAALLSARNVPLFAIVAIPVLSEQIEAIIKIQPETLNPGRLLRVTFHLLALILLLVTGLRFYQVLENQNKSEADTFPKAAVDWIENNHPTGTIFNSYGWGGYLIWRLYPEYPVYIDGRADVYGDKFLYAFMDIYHAQPGWEQSLIAQNVHLVLVEPGSNLAISLRQSSDWNIIFEDKISILFSKN